jgi:hypothetical protein
MPTGGSGTGLGQDATVQAIIGLFATPTPIGGDGKGVAQDASLQELLAIISGVTPSGNNHWTQSDWYVDPINGVDTAAGTIGAPVKTVMGGIVAKWGTVSPILPQTTTIHLVNSETTGQESIFLSPYMVGSGPSNFVIDGTLGLTQIGATFACGAVTAQVQGNPGTLLQVAGMPAGAAAGMLIENVTRGCYAFIDSMAGATATLTQPLDSASLTTISDVAQPSLINTWTVGDQCKVFQLPQINLKSIQPVGGDGSSTAAPIVWMQNLWIPDVSGVIGQSEFNAVPVGIGLFIMSCRIDPFIALLGADQDVECGAINCWLPGGGFTYYSGITSGAVCTVNASFGLHLYDLSSIDGNVIFHAGVYSKGFYNIAGLAYFDGSVLPQFVVIHGNQVVLESSQTTTSMAAQLWGPFTFSVEGPNSGVLNQSGSIWADILTLNALEMDGASTGTSYSAGTWTDGRALTPANLDTYNGLQNPITGSRFANA